MANGYSNTRSKTNESGQQAPDGYHYMPDGRLMSDAEHYIKFGPEYVISDFIIDYTDIKQNGENRDEAYVRDFGGHVNGVWVEGENYAHALGKIPGSGIHNYYNHFNQGRIPIREIFISLSLIKEAMKENNDIRGCVKHILDVINDD